MDCLSLLLTCLMQNVYITGGLDYALNSNYERQEGAWCSSHWCKGPRSQLRIGTEIQLSRSLSLNLGLLHTSYIAESQDRGDESAFVSMTIRPFR